MKIEYGSGNKKVTKPLFSKESGNAVFNQFDVSGWVVLDKPDDMTSTHAVSAIRRIFNAQKAGHAGTLDPLASGVLPIALGEATKTVPWLMEARKTYLFTIRWGISTDTQDREGKEIARSDVRPSPGAIRAALPAFVGEIEQVPPQFSAVKVDGEELGAAQEPPRKPGWHVFQMDTARHAGRPHALSFTITAADSGARWFCFDAMTLP